MSVEFDTPANRIIQQLQPKNKFRIDTSLPDISFLRQLSVQGRMRYFQGNCLIDPDATIGFTPNIGETFFFIKAKCTNADANNVRLATIINDNQTREIFRIDPVATGGNFQFSNMGIDSLVGDGIKRFKITSNVDDIINTNFYGWVENTSRIRDVAT